MIATHNIKVNGRWVHAGEAYEEAEQTTMEIVPEEVPQETVPQETPAEEAPQEEVKPKSRRKKASA